MSNLFKTLATVTAVAILAFVSSCSKPSSTTTATCTAPSGLSATAITSTTATLNWALVTGATYIIQYRVVGSSTWTSTVSTTNSVNVSALTNSSNYEFEVKNVCGSSATTFSQSFMFTTSGCPAGYTGNNCDVLISSNFVGVYNVTDTGVVNGTPYIYYYTMVIQANATDSTKVNISDFGGFGSGTVVSANISGNTLTVPATTIGGVAITNGRGHINGNALIFSYTATDSVSTGTDRAVGLKQ